MRRAIKATLLSALHYYESGLIDQLADNEADNGYGQPMHFLSSHDKRRMRLELERIKEAREAVRGLSVV